MAVAAPNAPAGLTVAHFRAALDQLGSVAKGCRFAVRITPIGGQNYLSSLSYFQQIQNMIYVCDSAEFPGRGFNGTTARTYGPEYITPNQVQYGPANFSFICRTASLERQFFDDWMDIINPINTFNYKYPKQYYCQIDIFHYSEFASPASMPEVIYSWRLQNAWPTVVNPQQVTWADQDVLKLGITFAYKYWSRPGDPERVISKI
ncbi:hypothetical protein EB001_18260 [bacterium]|nr:hypothetical protein [bacterium]